MKKLVLSLALLAIAALPACGDNKNCKDGSCKSVRTQSTAKTPGTSTSVDMPDMDDADLDDEEESYDF
ncbi:MAG: hypothetical protein WD449_01600 [Candidatus Babeliales bacterium]